MHRSRGRRSHATPAQRRPAQKPAEAAGQHAPSAPRGSTLRRLMVTPTFVFSVTIVTMAVLAFGTTQTYLRFSSSGPDTGCGVGGCANPDASHTANGRTPGGPMAVGTPHPSARSPAPAPPGPSGDPAHPPSEVRITYPPIPPIPPDSLPETPTT